MSDKPKLKYERVLLKLSGDAMRGENEYGISQDAVVHIAQEVLSITALGAKIALVIGGGNILRGARASERGMNRATADYMGMLATIINALALQDAFESLGAQSRVMSAITAHELCEPYIRRRAMRHLEKGRIVVLAGGTGNPYFTTDTAAALRATELTMNAVIKATRVNGIYTADPEKNPEATMFATISYREALDKSLKVMDSTAFSLCMDNKMPIIVCSMREPGTIRKVVMGENLGTFVGG